jgi:hypothetical protein
LPQDERRLRVRGLRHATPDTGKLARAYIALALARAEADAEAQTQAKHAGDSEADHGGR